MLEAWDASIALGGATLLRARMGSSAGWRSAPASLREHRSRRACVLPVCSGRRCKHDARAARASISRPPRAGGRTICAIADSCGATATTSPSRSTAVTRAPMARRASSAPSSLPGRWPRSWSRASDGRATAALLDDVMSELDGRAAAVPPSCSGDPDRGDHHEPGLLHS